MRFTLIMVSVRVAFRSTFRIPVLLEAEVMNYG